MGKWGSVATEMELVEQWEQLAVQPHKDCQSDSGGRKNLAGINGKSAAAAAGMAGLESQAEGI